MSRRGHDKEVVDGGFRLCFTAKLNAVLLPFLFPLPLQRRDNTLARGLYAWSDLRNTMMGKSS